MWDEEVFAKVLVDEVGEVIVDVLYLLEDINDSKRVVETMLMVQVLLKD